MEKWREKGPHTPGSRNGGDGPSAREKRPRNASGPPGSQGAAAARASWRAGVSEEAGHADPRIRVWVRALLPARTGQGASPLSRHKGLRSRCRVSQPCGRRAIGPQVGKQTRSPQASFRPGGASATWPAGRPQQGPRRVRQWELGRQGHRGHVLQGRGPRGTPQTCANEQGGVPQGRAGEGAKGRRGHRAGGHSSFHQPSGAPALTPTLSTDSRGHTGRSGRAVPEQGC